MIDPGTVIDDRYEVLERVGSGGMADVYLAADKLLGRKVALKILHHRFAEDQEFVERFRREASSAAGLSHPNVVAIFDRGSWDGTYYMAMEYLPGRSLKQVVRDHGALQPASAIDVVLQILRAARFAHQRGVIHRDIKPHNVILDEEGRAKVTDFGIARAGASDMTLTGSIMGTAQYLSPEQAQSHPVAAASDLYAIGVVLFELLTGRVPFDGETAVTIALQHISATPPAPSSLIQGIPGPLDAVVLRALAKDPAERYRSADEMIEALEQVRAGLPQPLDENVLASAPWAPAGAGAAAAWAAGAGAAGPGGGAIPGGAAPDQAKAGDGNGAGAAYGAAGHDLGGQDPGGQAGFSHSSPTGTLVPLASGLNGDPAPPPDDRSGRRRRRRLVVWIAAAVIVALLVAAAIVLLVLPVSKVTVPGVTGKSRAIAVAKIEDAGLKAVVDHAMSSQKAGVVVLQAPRAGSSVASGSRVRITVSTGPGSTRVPTVEGLRAEKAIALLRKARLSPVTRSRPSETVVAGRVISTDPAAGEPLPLHAKVIVFVSSGPARTEVPDVKGMSLSEAEVALEKANLRVGSTKRHHRDGVRAGTVLRQSPGPGAVRRDGSPVALVVADGAARKHPGSNKVLLPSVLGEPLQGALRILREANLQPRPVSKQVFRKELVGQVIKQRPEAGSEVPPGSTVEIFVGKLAGEERTTTTTSTTQTTSRTTSSTSTTQTTSTTLEAAAGQ